jgi:fructokinase
MIKDIYSTIEFGGTKTVALIAQGKNNILRKRVFHTLEPLQTIQTLVDYFKNNQSSNNLPLKSIGIGCFGPLDINANSETCGSIFSTPKTV